MQQCASNCPYAHLKGRQNIKQNNIHTYAPADKACVLLKYFYSDKELSVAGKTLESSVWKRQAAGSLYKYMYTKGWIRLRDQSPIPTTPQHHLSQKFLITHLKNTKNKSLQRSSCRNVHAVRQITRFGH
jgi:hypothetical protein